MSALTELYEEDERLNTEVSVVQKKVMLRRLNREMGQGSWKFFSANGKLSGIDWNRVQSWFKTR